MAEVECSRKNKWFRACKFEARYDVQEPTTALINMISRQWGVSDYHLDKLTIKETYICDVCVTCGNIVKPE
jgi:hypothetical protein